MPTESLSDILAGTGSTPPPEPPAEDAQQEEKRFPSLSEIVAAGPPDPEPEPPSLGERLRDLLSSAEIPPDVISAQPPPGGMPAPSAAPQMPPAPGTQLEAPPGLPPEQAQIAAAAAAQVTPEQAQAIQMGETPESLAAAQTASEVLPAPGPMPAPAVAPQQPQQPPRVITGPQKEAVQAAAMADPRMAEAQTLDPSAMAEAGERASRLVSSARRILGMGIEGASALVRALGMSPIEEVDQATQEIAGLLEEMGGRISQEEAQAIAESRAQSGIDPSQDLFERLQKTPVKTLADEAPEVVGSIAGGMLAAGMTGMGAGMSLLGIGEQYERAREDGLDEEAALVQAIPTGIAIGALERLGLSKILGAGRAKWFMPRARKAIESAATEGGTEAAQELVSDLGSTLDEVRRGEAGFQDLRTLVDPESIRRYAQAGTLGALGGGIAGGVMPRAAAEAVTEGPQAAEAETIEIAETEVPAEPEPEPAPVAPEPEIPTPREAEAVETVEEVEVAPAPEPAPVEPEVPVAEGEPVAPEGVPSRPRRPPSAVPVEAEQETEPIPAVPRETDAEADAAVERPSEPETGDWVAQIERVTQQSRDEPVRLSEAVRKDQNLRFVHDPDVGGWRIEYTPDPTKPSDREFVTGVAIPGSAMESQTNVRRKLAQGLGRHLTGSAPKSLGIVSPGATRVGREAEIAGEKFGNWVKRTFTRTRGLPAELFEKGVDRDGKFSALDRQLQFDLRDLQKRINRYQGPLTRDQLERYLGDAYRGMNVRIGAETTGFDETQIERIARRRDLPVEQVRAEFERVAEREPEGLKLAPEFLPAISRIRLTVDAMTRDLRRMGELTDDVQRKLESTYGLYAHRDYDAFRDPDWRKRAEDQPLWNRAKDLFAEENPNLADEEVEGLMNAFLDRPQAILPGGIPEGARNLGSLMKRTEVADWKRRLLGERRDILSQHLDTAAQQAQLVYNYQYLNDLVQTGMGKYFFEKPTGEYYKPIDPDIFPIATETKEGDLKVVYTKGGKRRTRPLSGLHTSPEIHNTLTKLYQQRDLSTAARIYFGLNFLTKFGLTAGSVQTQNRNFLSASMPAMANGYLPFSRGFRDAFGMIVSDLAGRSTQELSQRLQFLDALSVTKQSTDYGDLRRLSRYIDSLKLEMTEEGGVDAFLERGIKTLPRKTLRKLSEIYRAYGDDTWKAFGFYKEKARLTEALGEEKANEVVRTIEIGNQRFEVTRADEEAAKIVRRVQQNYGELPKFWREVSKHPIVGPFASFTGSVLVNVKNTAQQAKSELQSDNSEIRAIGMRRAGGLLFTLSIPTLLANSLSWLLNMDDDDEEAIRTFAAPWDRNATLIPMKREKGKYVFFNAGFMDYYGRLKQPMMAAYRAARGRTEPVDPVIEMLDMAGGTEEILAGALADIRSNKTEHGGEIWNPADPTGLKAAKISQYLWDTVQPGAARSVGRIWSAARGKVTPTGRVFNLAHELLALVGPRISTVDTAQAMEHWIASGTARSIADATRIYNREANTRGTPDKEEIVEAYADANRARLETVRELREYIDAAVQSGLAVDEVFEAYKRGGGTQKYFDMALHGDGGKVTLLDPTKTKHFDLAADEIADWARKFVQTGEFYYSDEY